MDLPQILHLQAHPALHVLPLLRCGLLDRVDFLAERLGVDHELAQVDLFGRRRRLAPAPGSDQQYAQGQQRDGRDSGGDPGGDSGGDALGRLGAAVHGHHRADDGDDRLGDQDRLVGVPGRVFAADRQAEGCGEARYQRNQSAPHRAAGVPGFDLCHAVAP